jgi:hypothetical protein
MGGFHTDCIKHVDENKCMHRQLLETKTEDELANNLHTVNDLSDS